VNEIPEPKSWRLDEVGKSNYPNRFYFKEEVDDYINARNARDKLLADKLD
jgi:hypothetical protein